MGSVPGTKPSGSVAGTKGRVLLINPWIYGFAAYNLWIEPLGLLTVAAALREHGYLVTVVDCLAPHPGMPRPRADGSGKFLKTVLDRPPLLADVPRRYGRYGLPVELFERALAEAPRPDLVLVASGMTYWYPGVVEAIRRVRARFGDVPVGLGGIYATLCPDHARQHSGADVVVEGPGAVEVLRLADTVTGNPPSEACGEDPRLWPAPAHELVPRPYAGLITSWGCPYRCTYCASHRLQPVYVRRDPAVVLEEALACARRGTRDLAFYDDALLVDGARHLAPVLEGVLARGLGRQGVGGESNLRFHTPNGIHAGSVDGPLARLMWRSGFATLRLSLETVDADRQRVTGAKVTTGVFEQAVGHLRSAGFGPQELGAYILAGLPGQPLSEVEATVRYVQRLAVQAKLALFSPIPGTPDGDRALPPDADPLLHNNTVYPYLLGESYVARLERIKLLAKRGNEELLGRVQ